MKKRNHNFKNLEGVLFGHLTVICIDEERSNTNHIYWLCKCVCGKTRSLQTHQLTSGKVTSCGCKSKYTGITAKHKRLYSVYSSMIARCFNKQSASYNYYGAKGIFVCDSWKNDFYSFAKWAYENGYNDSLSIDRIDNHKGYSPENCRWVVKSDQAKNKDNNVWYTHNGKTYIMSDWCRILNFPYTLAKSRRKEANKKNINPTFEYVFAPPKFKKYSSSREPDIKN